MLVDISVDTLKNNNKYSVNDVLSIMYYQKYLFYNNIKSSDLVNSMGCAKVEVC